MGREVRRVPLDFDWPLNRVWSGYLMPDELREDPCPDCESGWSPHAQHLYDQWYGKAPFDPASTGSTPLRHETPVVRALAERNIQHAPSYYGSGEYAIVREARRLADMWNTQWGHHLCQADVDALVTDGRLMDFTHTWTRETGWRKIEPPVTPTAAAVNEWSIGTLGHDSINAHIVIRARCEREGIDDTCPTCQGHATVETYPGQRAEAEAWERTDPPDGDGWQLWETVSEGSPVSSVFATADELAEWMTLPERAERRLSLDVARRFVADGWAPTFVGVPGIGLLSGEAFIGGFADPAAVPDDASDLTVDGEEPA
ncbi:hypothetical protein [Embleya scabrispora]|uniref:hypothetical protein n=1 Tax=Embleya scabrispora TaxID=159449 RepID=UPI00117CA3E1|nr:hypothetical protein [Embleya scabrispora]